MHRRIVFLVLTLLFTSCQGDPERPGDRTEGAAGFEFLSSWEPSIEKRGYVSFVDYSFILRNVGGHASAPDCDILFRDDPLDGWSEGDEIGAGRQGRVNGRALLPSHFDTKKVLTRLEPRCREADNYEPIPRLEKRFFGKEGDEAYFDLRRRGLKVRFGPEVSRAERLNVRGTRTHPEVVITELRYAAAIGTVTILGVDCVGREEDLC